jgi:hypothetical protein
MDIFSTDVYQLPPSDLARQAVATPTVYQEPSNTVSKPFGTPASILKYPLQRLDANSDYIEIKILEYCAAGLSLSPPEGTSAGSFAIGNAKSNLSKQKPLAYIHLPIPQNISDTQGVDWGEDRLNPIAAAVASAGGNLVEGNIQNAIGGVVNKVTAGIQDPSTIKTIQAALAAIGSNKLVGNTIDPAAYLTRATGQVLNPNLELLFKGPTLRSFGFNFDFAPRDAGEGQMVKKIIWTLKKHMVAKQKASGLIIGTPDVFHLQYKTGSRPHAFLNKFKPAALMNIDVNYTGSGVYATYSDSTPVHMTVSLQFRELNPIYFEEYENSDTNVGY